MRQRQNDIHFFLGGGKDEVKFARVEAEAAGGVGAIMLGIFSCLGSHCQNGSDRGTVWEVTAKMAVTGELFGKSPPKWQ